MKILFKTIIGMIALAGGSLGFAGIIAIISVIFEWLGKNSNFLNTAINILGLISIGGMLLVFSYYIGDGILYNLKLGFLSARVNKFRKKRTLKQERKK